MPPFRSIPEIFSHHRQIHSFSCAASALEFAAKCYGLIEDLGANPLQQDPNCQLAGFADSCSRELVGLKGHDEFREANDAMEVIESETKGGNRILAVSCVVLPVAPPHRYWHVLIAANHDGNIVLADPGTQKFLARNAAETEARLIQVGSATPDRDGIHLLYLAPKLDPHSPEIILLP